MKKLVRLDSAQVIRVPRCAVFGWLTLGLCLLFILLTGCVGHRHGDSENACAKGNFEQVTLCPGASAICVTEPCTALFEMPPGEGAYRVTSNNMDRGTFPAGQTVDLGAFWRGAHYIEVLDSNAPAAHFWVVGDK